MSKSGPLRAWQSQNLSPKHKTAGATLPANENKEDTEDMLAEFLAEF